MECQLHNINVYYETYGTGKPVIILHGFSCDHRMMAGSLEPIFADTTGYQRIYIDLPGMGQSKGEDWIQGSDDILTILLAFIEKVIPNQRFLIMGQSYGGYLSRGILSKKREWIDGMALICPVITPDYDKRDLPVHTVIARDEALMATLTKEEADHFAAMAVVQNSNTWTRYSGEILPAAKQADEQLLHKLKARYGLSFHVDELASPVEVPVLLLMGRQDAIVGYRDAFKLLEHYPRATFAVLDRSGHNFQIEQQHLFNQLIGEWIIRVEDLSAKLPIPFNL